MGRWTLDKELEDTAKATGSGYSIGARSARNESAEKTAAAPISTEGMNTDNETLGVGLYKRGGYVSARASGKRMYAKGGMVKGKSCG